MTAASGVGPRDRGDDAEGDIVGRGGASRVTRPSDGGSGRGDGARSSTARPLGAVLAALLAGLILGGIGTALYLQSADHRGEAAFTKAIDTTRYQAVILSNDKVYFGKLKSINDDYFELDSAFFLRETRDTADAEPVRALLPVNREIHAPDNTMLIRKAEVVLVENLAKDSPILTEIKRQKG
jgi:hypothetical protein